MRKRAPPTRPPNEVPALPPRALGDVRRLVVKVGSGVIATRGRLRPKIVADLVYDVTVLRHRGCEVILVVSGAVASGFQSLGLSRPPTAVLPRQGAAAIGQHKMMAMFARLFAKHRTEVGQLLMSADDIENRQRFLSARHTLLESPLQDCPTDSFRKPCFILIPHDRISTEGTRSSRLAHLMNVPNNRKG